MATFVGIGYLTITDVNDGVSMTLAPPSQVLAATNDGVVSAFASTTVTIREGATIGADWMFAAPVSSKSDTLTADLTFEWSSVEPGVGTLILTGMRSEVDAAYVGFTATKPGADPLTARYVVTKAKAGNPAKFAVLKSSVASVKRSGDSTTYTPSSITFSAVSISAGSGASLGVGAPVAYADGYIRIETYDGSTWTEASAWLAENPASSRRYPNTGSIYDSTVQIVRATLATASDFLNVLDQITVPIVADGRSAYVIAQQVNNFTGTESEWLDTLVGTFDPTRAYPNADPATDPAVPINVEGNAGTATALETPRTINGVSFDGTADVVIPVVKSTQTVQLDANANLSWTNGGEFTSGSYQDYTISSVDPDKCMVSITSSIGNSLGISVTTQSTLRNAKVSVVDSTTLRLSINTTHVSAVASVIVGSVRIVELY